jgi:hypothetical protein
MLRQEVVVTSISNPLCATAADSWSAQATPKGTTPLAAQVSHMTTRSFTKAPFAYVTFALKHSQPDHKEH